MNAKDDLRKRELWKGVLGNEDVDTGVLRVKFSSSWNGDGYTGAAGTTF
jgi:hypothetical protein